MPIPNADALATFDVGAAGGNREDLSDIFEMLIREDYETTTEAIGIKDSAKAVKHEWMEGELGLCLAECDEDITQFEVVVDMVAGDGLKFRPGTTFKVLGPYPEVMQVTDVVVDQVTFTRSYGNSITNGAGAIAANSTLVIIAHPVQEDASVTTVDREAEYTRDRIYNYTQILFDWVSVSLSQEVVLKAGVKSELAEQLRVKLIKRRQELNRSVLMNYMSLNGGADGATRTMGGILQFLSQAGSLMTNSAVADISYDMFKADQKEIYDNGGVCDLALMGSTQKGKISTFFENLRRLDRTTNEAGYVIDKVSTDFGTVELRIDNNIDPDKIIYIDRKRCKIMPLDGLAMGVQEVPRDGLAHKRFMSGEYTFEIKNALHAHLLRWNLKY
jgi:hypothetical protein